MPRLALVLLAPTALLGLAGCTLIVGVDPLAEAVPCEAPGDCRAGFLCTDGACEEAGGALVPPTACDSLATLDWVVPGPSGSSLLVENGALAGSTCVTGEAASASALIEGRTLVGAAVTFGPATNLNGQAVVRFSGTAAACASGCAVFRLDAANATWVELPAPERDGGGSPDAVEGRTVRLGTFAAAAEPGVAADAGPADAGVNDSGFDAGVIDSGFDAGARDAGPRDAGSGDGGVSDGGAAVTCDFDPASCPGLTSCVANPFDDEVGACLRSCVAPDPSCASCGSVVTLAGSWCRPAAWSGTVAAGGSCTVDADCDAATTNGCVDFGDGALVCAATCDPNDALACGAGCCASGQRGAQAGGFCRASPSCSQPDGTRCLTAGECASNTCETVLDGDARCTSSCTVDGSSPCGSGLCCAPSGCDGAGLCVAQQTCASTPEPLLCNALCVDDDACAAGEYCVDGACADLGACECLRHEHCGVGEFCQVAADGGAAVVCGACTALPATTGACYADHNCPNGGGAADVLCDPDDACEDDAFAQCEGLCRTLGPAECVSASDCRAGQVCVDNGCR